MKIKRMLSLLKSPSSLCRYAVREVKRTLDYTGFLLNKAAKADRHAALMRKVPALCSCADNTGLEALFKGESFRIFLCDGFEAAAAQVQADKNYSAQIIRQADAVLSDNFYVLYQTVAQARDKAAGHYKWDTDYRTGYKYKPVYFTKVRSANKAEGADIKRIWELARMQYLFAPALAYRLTGDERYALKVKDVLEDFIECNPLDVGANWNISMEVGIRAANMILAFELIRCSPCVDADFIKNMVASAIEHRDHILKNEETTAGKTSNHYLGGLLGIAATSVFCINATGSRKALTYASKAIEREINVQIHTDGGDYEGSTSYQRLVGELVLFTLIACTRHGLSISDQSRQRLMAMADYSATLSDDNGFVPQIGDNDCGRVFQLLPEDNRCHLFYMGLLDGFLNAGSSAKYKNGLECFVDGACKALPREKQRTALFEESGMAVVRRGSAELIVTANETQAYGGSGGHTHNDLLSFVLRINGREIITDPGSGCYTGDAALRNQLRFTAAHSTVAVNEAEQRIPRSGSLFAWDSKVNAKLTLAESDNGVSVCGTHDGYLSRFQCIHDRELTLSQAGDALYITDRIDGGCRGTFTLPVGEDISCRQTDDGRWVLDAGDQKVYLEASIPLRPVTGCFSPRYDCTTEHWSLCGTVTQAVVTVKMTWEES